MKPRTLPKNNYHNLLAIVKEAEALKNSQPDPFSPALQELVNQWKKYKAWLKSGSSELYRVDMKLLKGDFESFMSWLGGE